MRARWLVGLVLAAHALLLLAPPLALTDVMNYAEYGRMGPLSGLDPYRVPSVAAPHDLVWTLANWHGLRSPYGPLFTLATQAGAHLRPAAWLWVWKGVVVGSSLATVGLVAALARRTGADVRRAVACLGLSPLLLLGEVGGLHNDGPCVLAVVAAAWCLVRSREEDAPAWAAPAAGLLVVAAAGLKPSFAIVVPLVLLGAGSRPRALAGAAVGGLGVGAVVLLAFGGALPDVGQQSALVTPLSLPNLLGLAAGHGGADAVARRAGEGVLLVGTLAACVVVLRRRELALDALGGVLLLALLTLAWVMPWYLVWSLPFLALGRPKHLAWVLVPATAWLTLGAVPQLEDLMHLVGYFPTRLATGRANHEAFEALVR